MKEVKNQLKPYQDYLIPNTASAAEILALPKRPLVYNVVAEWFDNAAVETLPAPSIKRRKNFIPRSKSVSVSMKEPEYSKVDLNVGGPLQHITVELDYSIPVPAGALR